jgi:hypothetical protein
MPILEAIPIFQSNSTVNSIQGASALLKQNLNAIEESATGKLVQYGKSNEANLIGDMIFFSEQVTPERRAWRNDQYWLFPNRTVYVLAVPAVSKLENWAENESKILVERANLTEGTVVSITLPADAASFNFYNYFAFCSSWHSSFFQSVISKRMKINISLPVDLDPA